MDFGKSGSFDRSFNKSRGYSTSGRLALTRRSSPTRENTSKSVAPLPQDEEAESRERILQALLQKRRVLMSGFKEEDLRDVADVVRYCAVDPQ